MRRSLLAGLTLFGMSVCALSGAFAQTPAPVPAPAQKQILQVESGATGANSNNNYQPAPLPGSVAKPTPGTMVVHMDGRVWTQFGFGGR
jgi:hypothetical protein